MIQISFRRKRLIISKSTKFSKNLISHLRTFWEKKLCELTCHELFCNSISRILQNDLNSLSLKVTINFLVVTRNLHSKFVLEIGMYIVHTYAGNMYLKRVLKNVLKYAYTNHVFKDKYVIRPTLTGFKYSAYLTRLYVFGLP